jgi:hypothetical protein
MGVGTGPAGLRLGRELFHTLPETNRLRRHHEQRWALDTAADANFADMYLHPQETSYDLERLFRFVDQPGVRFAGFSNPEVWDPARLLQGELLERARALPPAELSSLADALAEALAWARANERSRRRIERLELGLQLASLAGYGVLLLWALGQR